MPYYLVLFLWFLPFSHAISNSIHLHGDERIRFASTEKKGEGRFCVRHDSAGILEKDWKVVFSIPAGGLYLKPLHAQGESVPFQLDMRSERGGRSIPVRNGDTLAKGSSLSSHCSEPGGIFYLEASPTQSLDLIPGGIYSQTVRLRLQVDDKDLQSFETQFQLNVPEQVHIKGGGNLVLPDFEGQSPTTAKVNLCVFRNGSGRYAVRMRGDGAQGAYRLKSATSDLNFQATWQAGTQPGEMLTAGELSQAYQGDSYRDCRGLSNASIKVKVQPEHELGAHTGHYQGLLRITVETR